MNKSRLSSAERMKRNFERGNPRCEFYDENQLPHEPCDMVVHLNEEIEKSQTHQLETNKSQLF